MPSNIRSYIVKGLRKAKLNKLAHKIYYKYLHGFNAAIIDTLPAVDRCLRAARESGVVENGDYYEFGLFKGYTFWHAQRTAESLGIEHMRFFGFDSFAGLPEVTGIDETKDSEFYKGQYSCNKEQVIENLNLKGVNWDRTFLIEGFFKESLSESSRCAYVMRTVAVALIDCDLYSSTVEVLKFIREGLVDGSILMFDDWNCFDRSNEKGQRRAFAEFLSQDQNWTADEFFEYGPHGAVFLMRHTNKNGS